MNSRSYCRIYVLLLMVLFVNGSGNAQPILSPVDSFHQNRFIIASAAGATAYVTGLLMLSNAWYAGNQRTSFHYFNDWNEWENVDKLGHAVAAYYETSLIYRSARWTGIKDEKALWIGALTSFLAQGSIEILDGYSAKWGFSLPDLAFNAAGAGFYGVQQALWNEQRMILKASTHLKNYNHTPILSSDGVQISSLFKRANQLFGKSTAERFLKDYNAQTLWISFNPSSFAPAAGLPPWLNIAMGYGAENMFGGYGNSWANNGLKFHAPSSIQRFPQYFVSPDIDFSRIKTKSKLLKTIFHMINFWKIPSPAVELNKEGVVFHWFYF